MWWLLPIQTVDRIHTQPLCPSWCYSAKWVLITVHCFLNVVNLHVWISLLGHHFTAIAPCTLLGIALGNSMEPAFSIHQNVVLGAADTMAILHCTYGLWGPLEIPLLHLLFLLSVSFFFLSVDRFCLFLNSKCGSEYLVILVPK